MADDVADATEPDWSAIHVALADEFPGFSSAEITTEIVRARESVLYVGIDPVDFEELVTLMVRYAFRVKLGIVEPSERLQPMPRTPK